jgi:hypothetical protein
MKDPPIRNWPQVQTHTQREKDMHWGKHRSTTVTRKRKFRGHETGYAVS